MIIADKDTRKFIYRGPRWQEFIDKGHLLAAVHCPRPYIKYLLSDDGESWEVDPSYKKPVPRNPTQEELSNSKNKEMKREVLAAIRGAANQEARERYIYWMIDPSVNNATKTMIKELLQWADEIWKDYKIKKDVIEGGDLGVELEPMRPAPYTFWDIEAMVNDEEIFIEDV